MSEVKSEIDSDIEQTYSISSGGMDPKNMQELSTYVSRRICCIIAFHIFFIVLSYFNSASGADTAAGRPGQIPKYERSNHIAHWRHGPADRRFGKVDWRSDESGWRGSADWHQQLTYTGDVIIVFQWKVLTSAPSLLTHLAVLHLHLTHDTRHHHQPLAYATPQTVFCVSKPTVLAHLFIYEKLSPFFLSTHFYTTNCNSD